MEPRLNLLDGFADVRLKDEIGVELRESQPKTARPKTVAVLSNSRFDGITLPSSRLNPSRDGNEPR